jgi:hypothetical protein
MIICPHLGDALTDQIGDGHWFVAIFRVVVTESAALARTPRVAAMMWMMRDERERERGGEGVGRKGRERDGNEVDEEERQEDGVGEESEGIQL